MDPRTKGTATDWNASQWASIEQTESVDDVPKWDLWHWVSRPPRPGHAIDGLGDSALSGSGQNPSGQRWAIRHDTRVMTETVPMS
jgi:hypothetical protein